MKFTPLVYSLSLKYIYKSFLLYFFFPLHTVVPYNLFSSLKNLIEQEPDYPDVLISLSVSSSSTISTCIKVPALEKSNCSRDQFETATWNVQVIVFIVCTHGTWWIFWFLSSGYSSKLTINVWMLLNSEKNNF